MAGRGGREKYRHRITLYRRAVGADGKPVTAGGYGNDLYRPLGETSCQVRDESDAEYQQAESSRIEHVKTFTMRARDVKMDDLILWGGDLYRVLRTDAVFHLGREIKVKAAHAESRYKVQEDEDGQIYL